MKQIELKSFIKFKIILFKIICLFFQLIIWFSCLVFVFEFNFKNFDIIFVIILLLFLPFIIKETIYKIYCIIFSKCKYYVIDILNVEIISSKNLKCYYNGGNCIINAIKGLKIKKGEKAILLHFNKFKDEVISYKKSKYK